NPNDAAAQQAYREVGKLLKKPPAAERKAQDAAQQAYLSAAGRREEVGSTRSRDDAASSPQPRSDAGRSGSRPVVWRALWLDEMVIGLFTAAVIGLMMMAGRL